MRRPLIIPAVLTLIVSSGCQSHDREFTRQALDRQADQNEAMATLQREVAAGARELVAGDADANRRILEVHSQLQEERATLAASWGELESHRRSNSAAERRDSFLSALVRGGGATAAALLALAIVRSSFDASPNQSDGDVSALLLDYLTPTQVEQVACSHLASKQAATLQTAANRLAIRNLEES